MSTLSCISYRRPYLNHGGKWSPNVFLLTEREEFGTIIPFILGLVDKQLLSGFRLYSDAITDCDMMGTYQDFQSRDIHTVMSTD